MKYIKLSKRIFNQSVRLEESIITIFCTGKGVMECETSVMVSEENSKEEDDLLLQSIRKVKRKANEKEIPLEREDGLKKMAAWARSAGIQPSTPFNEIEVDRGLPPSWQRLLDPKS